MKKIIIFSTDSYCDLEKDKRKKFIDIINDFVENGHRIIFTARSESKKVLLEDISFDNKSIFFFNRMNLKDLIKKSNTKQQYFVVVGNREQDLFLAATNKLFYIVPYWCKEYDDKVLKYGIKVKNLDALKILIDTIDNQNSWYYRLDLDDRTTILSLTSANTYGNHSNKELDMINGFRNYLKKGNKEMSMILLCHFLAAISNNNEFREINDWGIVPSSGTELNEDMWHFKEKARELMNGRKVEPIFIRHTKTFKGHEETDFEKRLPCDRHFNTIKLHEKYSNGKLKGRTVCIFDDYLTNGTTFESARNLLIKEGVKKIFFVSLGRFGKKYVRQDYEIKGNVFSDKYEYKLKTKNYEYGAINNSAVKEIENLHSIFFE